MAVCINGGRVPMQAGNVPVDGSITTNKLADGAVTTPKVADGAITDAKLANPNRPLTSAELTAILT